MKNKRGKKTCILSKIILFYYYKEKTMSWKHKAIIGLTVASSWLGISAKENTPQEEGDSIRKEQFQPNADKHSIVLEKRTHMKDSVPTDSVLTPFTPVANNSADTIAGDSVCISENLKRFKDTEYDMLCLVAHCEGVKIKAYWDPNGKIWTIGFGNTVRPDGKPVRRGDKIKSEEELKQYFSIHAEKYIFSDMDKYLNMEKMSEAEIVAVGSFLYNCGSGCLRTYNKAAKKYEPSNFAKNLNEFFETHSEESKAKVKEFMDRKVTAKGKTLPQLVKRRDLEERILFGDIILNNDGVLTEGNALDFSEIPLGGIYSIGNRLPADTLDLCSRLRGISCGQNLTDSIQSQFSQPARDFQYKQRVQKGKTPQKRSFKTPSKAKTR